MKARTRNASRTNSSKRQWLEYHDNPWAGSLRFLFVATSVAMIMPDCADCFLSSTRTSSHSHSHSYSASLSSSMSKTASFTKYPDAVSSSSKITHGSGMPLISRLMTRASTTLLSAHYLTTALENLWEHRRSAGDANERDDYECLEWLDLGSGRDHEDGEAFSVDPNQNGKRPVATLPLYPLSEVYLPMSLSGTAVPPDRIVNHTLNNVEPQNVKMALDLLAETTSTPPCFCVVLRAMDTGRIATVGTILRIVDADVQKVPRDITGNELDDDDDDEKHKIARVRLMCQSEGLVEILGIENGSGWSEKRVLRSDEYLQAKVRPMVTTTTTTTGAVDDATPPGAPLVPPLEWTDAYEVVREDLRMIKLIYQLQLGREDYPPDTLSRLGNAMQDFPALEEAGDDVTDDDDGDALVWRLAQEWQSVCTTLQQGRQALLASERNERMVAAAVAASPGQPLKLPIHESDLDLASRATVQRLDRRFQEAHEASGMDPTLDFQVLLGLPTTERRFGFLARLVARERRRLEGIASSMASSSSSSTSRRRRS